MWISGVHKNILDDHILIEEQRSPSLYWWTLRTSWVLKRNRFPNEFSTVPGRVYCTLAKWYKSDKNSLITKSVIWKIGPPYHIFQLVHVSSSRATNSWENLFFESYFLIFIGWWLADQVPLIFNRLIRWFFIKRNIFIIFPIF